MLQDSLPMEVYETPLCKRYASTEMCYNFSEKRKVITWRKLWLNLASAQKKLGVRITDEQLAEMEENIEKVDLNSARQDELQTKHDVMAHIVNFSRICPKAAPIIHLGATSSYVTDNSDLINIRDGLDILIPKIVMLMYCLSEFCEKHKSQPTLGYTHLQPAQLTTVGRRACLWLSDLISDYNNITQKRKNLKFRGVKGTIGTQASFLTLFSGNYQKVKELDDLVTNMAGFEHHFEITGQTYSRKSDVDVLLVLSSFGSTIHKMCTDIRLLCGFQEISEPFESETQVGSSAMPYKQNPIRTERCCALARHLGSLVSSMISTHSVHWLERTLDDSAIRRIIIPEAFLIADSLLDTMSFVIKGLNVYPGVINKRIDQEIPFLAVESILIEMVNQGANRNECHEKLRVHSLNAMKLIKLEGKSSQEFTDNIKNDPYFKPVHQLIDKLIDPHIFIGCAKFQVDDFLQNVVKKILTENQHHISKYKSRVIL